MIVSAGHAFSRRTDELAGWSLPKLLEASGRCRVSACNDTEDELLRFGGGRKILTVYGQNPLSESASAQLHDDPPIPDFILLDFRHVGLVSYRLSFSSIDWVDLLFLSADREGSRSLYAPSFRFCDVPMCERGALKRPEWRAAGMGVRACSYVPERGEAEI